jgi:hypothetical protein
MSWLAPPIRARDQAGRQRPSLWPLDARWGQSNKGTSKKVSGSTPPGAGGKDATVSSSRTLVAMGNSRPLLLLAASGGVPALSCGREKREGSGAQIRGAIQIHRTQALEQIV